MKLSNFNYLKSTQINSFTWTHRATVDVTTTTETGALWWRKEKTEVETREIERRSIYWYFVDTGEFTPSNEVEALERSFSARTGKYLNT